MHFFHSIWKNLHLTEIFYTDMSVVSVTNKRYAYGAKNIIPFGGKLVLKSYETDSQNGVIATTFELEGMVYFCPKNKTGSQRDVSFQIGDLYTQ